jgi:hypothetical protein
VGSLTESLHVFRIKAYIKILSHKNFKYDQGEFKKKICTESDVTYLLNSFFKITPTIGIYKNEKIDFFAREL